jgi:diguanylate cyclase (GGDEF)-like protein/PAS domain S-box-containing protein
MTSNFLVQQTESSNTSQRSDALVGHCRVLLVNEEPNLFLPLSQALGVHTVEFFTARTRMEALSYLSNVLFDLVLIDTSIGGIDCDEIMDFISEKGTETETIVISGEAGIEAAISAIKRGVYDYLRKPFKAEELLHTVQNALKHRALRRENESAICRLKNSEKMYRYLVDSSPDIIYTLNDKGCFTFVNERAYQLLGYNGDELIGQHYSTVVCNEDMESARYVFNERRSDERASRNVELRLKRRAVVNRAQDVKAALITVSLNATGINIPGSDLSRLEFYGTYGVARDVTESKRAQEVISYQAYHDILTDLPNRVLFRDRLGLAVIQAKRKKTELAVMFIDLDRFKLVNDTLGHVKGDELLQQVSVRLKDCLRQGDTLARLGGDEFSIVLPEVRDREDAGGVAAKVLERLGRPFDLNGHEVHISASIGTAIYPYDGESIEQLLCHADSAMYQVKGSGKNGHVFYDPAMHDMSHQRIALEHSLRCAIEHNELEMYYQPQIEVTSGRVIGAEALMRWHHATRGVLLPAEFFPLTEDTSLLISISNWMIRTLLKDMHLWANIGGRPKRLSLNISPQYLDNSEFYQTMRECLTHHDIGPGQIEIEITEDICIRSPQQAIDQLGKLGELGVSVAVDDFGTGYSALAHLHRSPIHTIKIDRSFVKDILDVDGYYPVVLAIISIARGLSLNLVAEGVENETQACYLRANGCMTMQGCLFYPPMPLGCLVELLHGSKI